MTNAATQDARLVIERTAEADHHLIHDIETSQSIGTLVWPQNSPYDVLPFIGKGGITTIITSKTSGLKYFALPGSTVQLEGLKLEMAGHPIPLGKAAQPKAAPAQQKADDSLQTMVLGAGLATRFEPVSGENSGYSKPAVPLVGETSVIEAIADGLSRSGYNRLFVNTYFKPESLKAGLAKTAQGKANTLTYIDEPAPSGTAGALRKILQSPEQYGFDTNKPVLVVQGDAVTDVDYSKLYAVHQQQNALVTIGCMTVAETEVDKFGIVVTDKSGKDGVSGKITSFQEKPKQQDAKSSLANTGFYIFSPDAYPIIMDVYKQLGELGDSELDFAKNIFPAILEKALQSGRSFWAHQLESDSYWNDIGNPFQYLETVHDIFHGKVRLPLPAQPDQYFDNGVFYWPGAKEAAKSDKAQLIGNVIVAKPFK